MTDSASWHDESVGGFRPARQQGNMPATISARDLATISFPPIKFVVPGYLVEGLSILAGKPKLGKSWLCLDIALAVASGGLCLGNIRCEGGDVLYLALEDNSRRLQSRLFKLWAAESTSRIELPSRLHLATEWPSADKGGVEMLRAWLENHPEARLIIIDVLARFRPGQDSRQTLYDGDYKAIQSLQTLAKDSGIAVVVVHHTRKSAEENDPFEKVSGTLGLSGAADTTIILDRDASGCTLYGRGRDIEEFESAVSFDPKTCRWSILGDVGDVRRTDERKAILAALSGADEPTAPKDIAAAAGMRDGNVRRLLGKMVKTGEVTKIGNGKYALPGWEAHASPPR